MKKIKYEVKNNFYDEKPITESDVQEVFEKTMCNGGLSLMVGGICALKNGSISDQNYIYVCECPSLDSISGYTWSGKIYRVLKTVLHEAMKNCGAFELEECAEAVPLFDLDDDGERIDDKNKYIIFDNEKTADRYCVVFTNRFYPGFLNEPTRYECLAASENPFHPQGIGLHAEAHLDLGCEHLGKGVKLDTLPENVKRFIKDNLI